MNDYRDNLYKGATPTIFENARNLRKNLTNTEQILWQALRKDALGVSFRRQHPIDTFVLDFYCHKRRLGIEVDGEYHQQNDQLSYDEWRTVRLEEQGITIIRFTNYEVEEDLEKVLRVIVGWLEGVEG
jgi:very-short-patch-repair endonuclease